ncbi:MAG: hypothetical protein FWG51_04275 [Firmicutes bacterium]|nr:hypothetical protein [Bacillota bacterium]
MAKAALSITLDKGVIEELKVLAKQEKRTVSNLSEVIFSWYIEEKKQKTVDASVKNALDFTKSLKVLNYNQTEKILSKNVFAANKDKSILDF